MTAGNVKTEAVSVLIAESYNIARIGLRETLKAYKDIKVTGEAENTSEVFELALKLKPDIILTDIFLHNSNIRNTLLRIKENLSGTKIIILTSHKNPQDIMSVLSTGVNACCSKSITPDKLALVIRNVAKGACWFDSAVSETALNMFKSSKYYNDSDFNLTSREKEVLKHIVNGESNTEIAKNLTVSVHTAKAHVCSVIQKLGVTDRVQAAVLAVKSNIV